MFSSFNPHSAQGFARYMPRPLRSDDPAPAQDIRFKDFGILDAGSQSKSSVATAVVLNVLALLFVIVIGAATKRTIEQRRELTMVTLPLTVKPPEPIKPLPRPPLPKPPVVKVEPPKIKLPDVKAPEIPKPTVVKMMQPAPVVTPAPPRKVIAPPAPKAVSLAHPMAASVVNNSPHPTAVALGQAENPIAPSNRPATAAVNLGQRGLAGMPATNSGGGPPATRVNLGSGSPGGQQLAGNGVRPVEGVKLGVRGGTGPMNSTSRQVGQVNLGQNTPPPALRPTTAATPTAESAPKVLYKPTPAYTPEAASLHISGSVAVRIRVATDGAVTVLGIASPLGHGLDQSAENAIRGTRFAPARDASGRPVDWEGVVRVNFQLAG